MSKTRTLVIEFHTALHHGSGYGLAGLVDRAIVRDSRRLPYLAGSALKGWFRFAALRLLRNDGENRPVCLPDKPCAADPCLLCTVFGSARQRGCALFEDAFPALPERSVLAEFGSGSGVLPGVTDGRASVALDRGRGVARRNHLFSTETVPPLVRFEGEIRGDLTKVQEELLQDCTQLLTHFGAGGARGLGFCAYKLGPEREEP
jgi:CRISPR/Cas system CSM-associated protein Csm3 (group 7 of RAMP superfamily)